MTGKKNSSGPKCGAKRKRGGDPCQLPAGFRTPHPGEGRCIFHGGFSKGPGKGNKNAMKTGEHVTIYLDQLTDEEKELLEQQQQAGVVLKLDNEIALANIRVRRMLQLRQKVLDGWEQDEKESTYERRRTDSITADPDGYEMVETLRTEKKREMLARVQAIEDGITRVQKEIARMLETKHKIETGSGGGDDDPSKIINVYIDALKGAAEEVWTEEDPDDNGTG